MQVEQMVLRINPIYGHIVKAHKYINAVINWFSMVLWCYYSKNEPASTLPFSGALQMYCIGFDKVRYCNNKHLSTCDSVTFVNQIQL